MACCLISVVCEMRILLMGVRYLRHAVQKVMKSVCYIWVCHCWAWYCQCLCAVVDSSSKVIVWFPIPVQYGSVFAWV